MGSDDVRYVLAMVDIRTTSLQLTIYGDVVR